MSLATGLEPEQEVVGKTWAEVIGDDQFAQVKDYAEMALAGKSVSYARVADFPSRKRVPIRSSMFPNFAADGSVAGLVTIADIERNTAPNRPCRTRAPAQAGVTDNIGMPLGYFDESPRGVLNRTSEDWLGSEVARKPAGNRSNQCFQRGSLTR